jgi:hypothetical protein
MFSWSAGLCLGIWFDSLWYVDRRRRDRERRKQITKRAMCDRLIEEVVATKYYR